MMMMEKNNCKNSELLKTSPNTAKIGAFNFKFSVFVDNDKYKMSTYLIRTQR